MQRMQRCKYRNFANCAVYNVDLYCDIDMKGRVHISRSAGNVWLAFEYRGSTERQVIEEYKMRIQTFLCILCVWKSYAQENNNLVVVSTSLNETKAPEIPIGCLCGVFLSGQFRKGSKEQPKGNPALLHEHSDSFPCTSMGNKLCTNRCLDIIVKHLPNSPAILCGSIDRDAHKERAYLFIKNCKDEWINTNLSAGREYCCKEGLPYKCPILS